jgi:hypothetical protein
MSGPITIGGVCVFIGLSIAGVILLISFVETFTGRKYVRDYKPFWVLLTIGIATALLGPFILFGIYIGATNLARTIDSMNHSEKVIDLNTPEKGKK